MTYTEGLAKSLLCNNWEDEYTSLYLLKCSAEKMSVLVSAHLKKLLLKILSRDFFEWENMVNHLCDAIFKNKK